MGVLSISSCRETWKQKLKPFKSYEKVMLYTLYTHYIILYDMGIQMTIIYVCPTSKRAMFLPSYDCSESLSELINGLDSLWISSPSGRHDTCTLYDWKSNNGGSRLQDLSGQLILCSIRNIWNVGINYCYPSEEVFTAGWKHRISDADLLNSKKSLLNTLSQANLFSSVLVSHIKGGFIAGWQTLYYHYITLHYHTKEC